MGVIVNTVSNIQQAAKVERLSPVIGGHEVVRCCITNRDNSHSKVDIIFRKADYLKPTLTSASHFISGLFSIYVNPLYFSVSNVVVGKIGM